MQTISAKTGLTSGVLEFGTIGAFFLLTQIGDFDTLASSLSYR
jgi:hypothetical protein